MLTKEKEFQNKPKMSHLALWLLFPHTTCSMSHTYICRNYFHKHSSHQQRLLSYLLNYAKMHSFTPYFTSKSIHGSLLCSTGSTRGYKACTYAAINRLRKCRHLINTWQIYIQICRHCRQYLGALDQASFSVPVLMQIQVFIYAVQCNLLLFWTAIIISECKGEL